MTRTRIFIVHENSILAGQAASLFNNEPQLHVVDLITSTQDALTLIGNGNCDCVLVSATLAKNGALQLVKCLHKQSAQVKVIVTGLNEDPKQILPYIAAGAIGYILKNEGIGAWPRHIEAVCKGKPLVSPAVTAALVTQLNTLSHLRPRFESKTDLYAQLTSRECEILELLVEGSSDELIAERLLGGVGTVKNHIQNVLKNLKLRSRKATSAYRSLGQRRAALAQVSYAH